MNLLLPVVYLAELLVKIKREVRVRSICPSDSACRAAAVPAPALFSNVIVPSNSILHPKI